MKNRVITAIFFVLIMLGGVYVSPFTFILLFGIIAGICLWEFYSIANVEGLLRRILSITLGMTTYTVVAIFQLTTIDAEVGSLVALLLLFFPLIFLFFLYEMSTASEKPFQNIAATTMGIVYIGIPFTLLEWIALDAGYRPNLVCGLLLLTWTNDTSAYLVGSRIGKTPLLPRISPKKTWEGTLSGAFFTLLTGVGLGFLFPELRFFEWLILAMIVLVFGSLGDLVESMLKRSVQIKDSGTLLPGHGGLLDRFDAFIFFLPFAAAYLLLIK